MSKIWQHHHSQIIASRLNQSLGILAGLLMISATVAKHSKEAWLGLANFLPFFGLFIALKIVIRHPSQLKQLSWLLILPSLPIVILGWGQLFSGWQTSLLLESILGWQLVPLGVPEGRMSAVFIYTNFLAIYLAIALTLAFGLWLETWQSWQHNLTKLQSTSKQTQALLLLTVILLADISGLILTSSRNAWGLAVISFMAYAVYMSWRWLVWGVTGAATTTLWASFAPNFGGTQLRLIVPAFFWARLADQNYERPIATLRLTQWQFCWDLIQQRPLFGWGLRNFTPLYEAQMNFWFGHPHNLFLMLLAETGIIASLLFMAIVGSIIIQSINLLINWSSNGSKLIFFSYLVAFSNCILFNLLDVSIFDFRVNMIGWILLSAISGVVRESKKAQIVPK